MLIHALTLIEICSPWEFSEGSQEASLRNVRALHTPCVFIFLGSDAHLSLYIINTILIMPIVVVIFIIIVMAIMITIA